MASTSISAPMRSITHRLARRSLWHQGLAARPTTCLEAASRHHPKDAPPRRCITTATSTRTRPAQEAAASNITTPAATHTPVVPFEEQTVLATIHQFPSLEPLRFQRYPSNHLYLPTRRDILHRAVVYEGDMTRSGTASTKTRYEIRGSRRKLRPQKGTGHARLGDRGSPMLKGGGVSHGPKPRDFATELPKKVYDLAWRTALSYRFRKGELIIVDNAIELESPSTRLLQDMLKYHEKVHGKGRSLLVTLEERPLLEQALIDMDRGEQTLTWEEVDVKNLLELSRIIIERDALHNILLTHQEDITHKAVHPAHRSLVRSSPPADLETIIGWSEFRALSLTSDPAEKPAAQADAYTSAASARYTYAESLAQGTKRSELTISAYRLLAEAKEIEFKAKTGSTFERYQARLVATGSEEEAVSEWPRIQVLDYQIEQANELLDQLSDTASQRRVEQASIDLQKLQLEKLVLQHEAAQLAAQVHEHNAEAERLAGLDQESEAILALASAERTQVDIFEENIATVRTALKESGARGSFQRHHQNSLALPSS